MRTASAILETPIHRVVGELGNEAVDQLAVEEPLEIRLGYDEGGRSISRAISITMRTPGDDAELAAGFLFTEGIISSPKQIKQIRHCGLKIFKQKGTLERAAALNSNTIRVDLIPGVELDLERLKRHFYTSSSCGVCGKSSIDALLGAGVRAVSTGISITADIVRSLPGTMREEQRAFDTTGGLHASALFDEKGGLDILREDVGRHNALDKVIGAKFMSGETPLDDRILLVSGRVSFELVQKALMAGVPILAAVGAPSSLAVELADEFGMTLIGFVRGERFNIYSKPERVI